MTPGRQGELRAAVVGAGQMGQHHARLYASLPGVRLVAVADRDVARAEEVAARHGARAVSTAGALLGEVDIVSVAVPTTAHLEVAAPFLERGIACLVEKPIAPDLAEAEAMLAAARRGGAVLMTGHSERFNPALTAARPFVRRPGFIEAQRLASFSPRSLDIDVVLDLMIHDIDAILDLVGEAPIDVDAVGVAALTENLDLANARLRFPSGCAANLTASRMSLGRVRKLRIFQPDAYISIDSGTREVLRYSLARGSDGRPDIRAEEVQVPEGEPLALELTEFMAAVREGRLPRSSGEEGMVTLRTALMVRDRMTRVRAEPGTGGR